MKSVIMILVAMLASIVSAQVITLNDMVSRIPACANICLAQAIPKTPDGCQVLDQGCQCRSNNRDFITNMASPCVLQNCPPMEAFFTLGITDAICQIEGDNGYTLPATSSFTPPMSFYSAFSLTPRAAAPARATALPMAIAGAAVGLAGLAL